MKCKRLNNYGKLYILQNSKNNEIKYLKKALMEIKLRF